MNLVLVQDALDQGRVQPLRLGGRRVEGDAARLARFVVDGGRVPVEAHADGFQLARQDGGVRGRAGGVEDHQEQVGRLAHRNDLAPAPPPLRRALDDARQVQQLDLGVPVVDDARNAGQGRELVGGRLGLRAREGGEERGFADRGKPDHGHPGVTVPLDLKPLPTGATLGGRLLQLGAKLGQLGLQLAQVVLGGLRERKRERRKGDGEARGLRKRENARKLRKARAARLPPFPLPYLVLLSAAHLVLDLLDTIWG